MKSKTVMTLAVAGTFGWSAAALANAGHEVITPSAAHETGPVIHTYEGGSGSADTIASTGAFMDEAGGILSGPSAEFGADHSAALSDDGQAMDETLALADEGIYSDYYLVSWTPASAESWDYYVIDIGDTPEQLAAAEEIYILSPPRYDVVWMPVTFDAGTFPSGSEEEASG